MASAHMKALIAFSVFALIHLVAGHGGGLHNWTFLPTPTAGKELFRYQVASCSSWVSVNSAPLGPLPTFPATQYKLQVAGAVSIFYYLDGNCTDRVTTSIDINVNLTLNGAPYAGRQVNGYGFTGTCAAPANLYRHNASLGDSRFNLVWFYRENSVTTQDGNLFGAAPNVMISRAPPALDALRSIVLFPSPADSDPVCCDLAYNAPPPADFFTQGSFCRVPAPPPPSPLPPSPPSPRPPRSPPRPPKASPKPSPKPSPKRARRNLQH